MIAMLWNWFVGLKASVIMYAVGAAFGGVFLIGVYSTGYNAAARKCEAAALRAELATVKADLAAARAAADDASQKVQTIEQAANEARQRTDAYVEELKNRPAPACVLDDADLRRGMRPKRRNP